MAYRLKPGKLKRQHVRAIAREQAQRAVAVLAAEDVSPAGVHDTRKVVKRLRALLKLIEPSMPKREFAARYRGIGRAGDLLAGARDRHVMEETTRKLEAHSGAGASKALAALKAHLQPAGDNGAPHLSRDDVARARLAFAGEARQFSKLALRGKGFPAIEGGLEGTYRLARKTMARAYAAPSDENFHELRKAVQWHWRHMSLLSRCWPGYFGVRISACQDLAEALGDDHDLAVLLEEVHKLSGLESADRAALEKIVRGRQQQLREAAYGLAERLFAERPRAFARRMRAYWEAKSPPPLAAGKPDAAAGSPADPDSPGVAMKSHNEAPSQRRT